MNAQDLYEEIKHALNFLGLKFHDMDKVEVTLDGRMLTFSYGGNSAAVGLPPAK